MWHDVIPVWPCGDKPRLNMAHLHDLSALAIPVYHLICSPIEIVVCASFDAITLNNVISQITQGTMIAWLWGCFEQMAKEGELHVAALPLIIAISKCFRRQTAYMKAHGLSSDHGMEQLSRSSFSHCCSAACVVLVFAWRFMLTWFESHIILEIANCILTETG